MLHNRRKAEIEILSARQYGFGTYGSSSETQGPDLGNGDQRARDSRSQTTDQGPSLLQYLLEKISSIVADYARKYS